MQTIFDPSAKTEILRRIDSLTPQTNALWGTMNVSQMCAHCASAAGLATGELKSKPTLIGRVIGPLFKSLAVNDKPFRKGSPTIPSLVVKEDKDFDTERARLRKVVESLSDGGPGKTTDTAHPFFGNLDPEEWGKLSFKHLDHHLRQFGV